MELEQYISDSNLTIYKMNKRPLYLLAHAFQFQVFIVLFIVKGFRVTKKTGVSLDVSKITDEKRLKFQTESEAFLAKN